MNRSLAMDLVVLQGVGRAPGSRWTHLDILSLTTSVPFVVWGMRGGDQPCFRRIKLHESSLNSEQNSSLKIQTVGVVLPSMVARLSHPPMMLMMFLGYCATPSYNNRGDESGKGRMILGLLLLELALNEAFRASVSSLYCGIARVQECPPHPRQLENDPYQAVACVTK